MNRRIIPSCLLGLSLLSTIAAAEPLGRPGQFVLGAERLTGIYADQLKSESTETDAPLQLKRTNTQSTLSLAFLGQPGYGSDSGLQSPSHFPRLGADVFVTTGLSVGGSLLYWRSSGETESESQVTDTTTGESTKTSETEDDPTLSIFQVAPRLGYAIPFSDAWSLGGAVQHRRRMLQRPALSR